MSLTMATENDVEIAVLREQIKGIREQSKAQYDTIREEIGSLRGDMKNVLNFMNQNKGGLKVIIACSTVAGSIGAGVTKLITVLGSIH